jgi:hypothetical protein
MTRAAGVLTPEMAAHVLREKAAREAKWQRALELWDATPDPHLAADETRDRGTAPMSVDAPAD